MLQKKWSAAGSDVSASKQQTTKTDSETTQDSLDDDEAMYDQDEEEIRELSKSHSQALLQIESWRPRNVDEILPDKLQVQVPFYIEAIDRFRRRKADAACVCFHGVGCCSKVYLVYVIGQPAFAGCRYTHVTCGSRTCVGSGRKIRRTLLFFPTFACFY